MDQAVSLKKISWRMLCWYYPVWVGYSLAHSFLTVSKLGGGTFRENLTYMLIMPVVFYTFSVIPLIIFKPRKAAVRRVIVIISALIISVLVTFSLTLRLATNAPDLTSMGSTMALMLVLTLALIVCWFFYIEDRRQVTENRIVEEQNRRNYNERKVNETYLRLLQAQVEPHFLFNTLTSILSLSDLEPQKAKVMQKNLMQYLKATLQKTRSSVVTVGQEIDLVASYLDIFKVRMGPRLEYSINAGEDVRMLQFPPMLIQPIVENAIKHGLEPKVEGGRIDIRVEKNESGRLRWVIEDTGLGMSGKSEMGTGLTNVMKRVESMFGSEGSFMLKENRPSGVVAELEIPYA
jgi:sensor histidine kinase YesM